MKRILLLIGIIFTSITLTACEKQDVVNNEPDTPKEEEFQEELSVEQVKYDLEDVGKLFNVKTESSLTHYTTGAKRVITLETTVTISDKYDGCSLYYTVAFRSGDETLEWKDVHQTEPEQTTRVILSVDESVADMYLAVLSRGVFDMIGYFYIEVEATNDPTILESVTLSDVRGNLVKAEYNPYAGALDEEQLERYLLEYTNVSVEDLGLECDFETQFILIVSRNDIPENELDITYSGIHLNNEKVVINYSIEKDDSGNTGEVFAIDFIVVDLDYFSQSPAYTYFFNQLGK